MTFAEFLASKRRTETMCADLGYDDGLPERGGFIYAGNCFIEDNTAGPPDFAARGKYYLLIERFDWVSDDLEEMEKILWACWHLHESDTGPLTGDDLDVFVQGFCAAYNIRVDGDVFGVAFSGKDAFARAEAEQIITSSAKAFGLYKGQ